VSDFDRIFELLGKLHAGPDESQCWLIQPHRELDEHAPLKLMLEGREGVVRALLEAAYLGLPT
jgi:hypothetical protein